jgi:hypothetical protein
MNLVLYSKQTNVIMLPPIPKLDLIIYHSPELALVVYTPANYFVCLIEKFYQELVPILPNMILLEAYMSTTSEEVISLTGSLSIYKQSVYLYRLPEPRRYLSLAPPKEIIIRLDPPYILHYDIIYLPYPMLVICPPAPLPQVIYVKPSGEIEL